MTGNELIAVKKRAMGTHHENARRGRRRDRNRVRRPIAAAESKVSVLSHGARTSEVAAAGLSARDVLSGGRVDTEADVVPDASGDYDLVLVAVRRDQLASACAGLAVLAGKPTVVFFGNNPVGRRPYPVTCLARSTSGSPGSAAS